MTHGTTEPSSPDSAPTRRDWMRRSAGGALLSVGAGALGGCATAGAPAAAAGQEGTPTRMVSLPVAGRTIEGRLRLAATPTSHGLIIAIHGGGYTGKYFDVPGSSALEQISQAGYNVVAFDRPGFGRGAQWLLDFDQQVPVLVEAVRVAQERWGTPGAKPFLYGHSIGGMLSLLMANAQPRMFSGISMTGSGFLYHPAALAGLRKRVAESGAETHAMSGEAARIAGFMGPEAGWDPAIAKLDPERDVPSSMADLRSVVGWQDRLPQEAARLTVPLHFVTPQFDGAWQSAAPGVAAIRAQFPQVPFAEIYVQRGAGHSVELQYLGRAHVYKMLAFAEECRLADAGRFAPAA